MTNIQWDQSQDQESQEYCHLLACWSHRRATHKPTPHPHMLGHGMSWYPDPKLCRPKSVLWFSPRILQTCQRCLVAGLSRVWS